MQSFPEFVKAAQILKEEDSPIKFAKVDGTEESGLLEKMHVTGYPTLFFYRNGESIKYAGEETKVMISVTRLGDLLHFGQFFKALARIIFPKLPTFSVNFCNGVIILHCSSEIFFGQLFTGHTGYDEVRENFAKS